MSAFTTWDPVRGGCGHEHDTADEAEACRAADARGCRAHFCLIQHAPVLPGLIGIEITDAGMAPVCRPNIDGQHKMPETPTEWRGRAAIEIAAEMDLPSGDWIAFQRPDLDSIGAAAVLLIRRVGLEWREEHGGRTYWPRRNFTGGHFAADGRPAGDFARRIALVAERDSFRPDGEWTPTPLPTEDHPWPEGVSTVDATREIAAIASICSPRGGDAVLPLDERAFITACWLLWGEPVDGPGAVWGHPRVAEEIARECGVETGRGLALDVPRLALTRARAAVEASRRALVRAIRAPGALEVREGRRGPVAVVRAAQAGVLSLGYCVAPVVVACDQATPGKFTVASWTPDGLDHAAVRARLNELEGQAGGAPMWGGGAAITGSPQVPGGSRLSDETVVAVVLEA